MNKSWTAKVPDHFVELSFSELNKRAGRKKYHGENAFVEIEGINNNDSKNKDSANDKYKNYSKEDLSGLPEQFS